jgi:Ni/Co efflux regulator RcnB
MNLSILQMRRPLACLVAGLLLTTAALAEKPDWAGGGNGNGNGKGGKSEQRMSQNQPGQSDRDHPGNSGKSDKGQKAQKQTAPAKVNIGSYFVDNQRTAVRTYYGDQYSVGRCPPGLAKKNNGCMPPGQARKWSVGQQLPRDVVYYSVPQSVVTQLGAPPPSHKYVRVAADILLIAVGTNMVIDAIQDLGRL